MESMPARVTRTEDLPHGCTAGPRRHQQSDLRRLATHAPMTHLLNRAGFVGEADRLLRAHRQQYAMVWIELAELDVVRQVFGFAVGDAALVVAAERLGVLAHAIGAVIGQPEDSALVALVPMGESSQPWPAAVECVIAALERPSDSGGVCVCSPGRRSAWQSVPITVDRPRRCSGTPRLRRGRLSTAAHRSCAGTRTSTTTR